MSARTHTSSWKRLFATLAAFWFMAGGHAAAPESNAPQRLDYSAFKIITDRNIFNAGRSGRSGSGPRETRRPARVDTVTLVGTLDYEKGVMAFFDGSNSEFRKALKADATIAGYKVAAITHGGVKLANGTNTVDLRVGMALRREDEGEWRVTARGDLGSGSTTAGSAGAPAASARDREANTTARDAGASGGDANEVLKRLMERRAKEEQ